VLAPCVHTFANVVPASRLLVVITADDADPLVNWTPKVAPIVSPLMSSVKSPVLALVAKAITQLETGIR
jgi:hypothetical protein